MNLLYPHHVHGASLGDFARSFVSFAYSRLDGTVRENVWRKACACPVGGVRVCVWVMIPHELTNLYALLPR